MPPEVEINKWIEIGLWDLNENWASSGSDKLLYWFQIIRAQKLETDYIREDRYIVHQSVD